ncbi:MAG TPA: extracellular solute-binding protein, partial [Dehalococcoidia bacterium]|nr:extracellular solute-binding protein [Dehalococcoidia bacterium]
HFFNAAELWEPAFKGIFEYIEETHPNIKITHIPTPYAEMHTKLVALVAGGTPPDLTSVPSDRAAGLWMQNVMVPLDDYMASDPPAPREDFMPSRLQDYTFDGTLFAIPIDQGSSGLYYNKRIFDEAGLDYPSTDWTYEDLRQTALQLTVDQSGKTAAESGFNPEETVQWGFQYTTSLHRMHDLLVGLGAPEYFDEEVSRCQMDSPEFVEALQWLIDLRCKDHVSPTAEQTQALAAAAGEVFPFGLGNYAMEFTWVGMVSALHKPGTKIGNDWDVTWLPKGEKLSAISSGQGFPIVNGSQHPDEAWEVIKTFVSEPVMKMLGENGAWLPARLSLAHYGQPADGIPEHYLEAFVDPLREHGFSPYWYVPGWDEAEAAIRAEIEPAWRCARTAQEAVNAFIDAANQFAQERPRKS